MSQARSGSWGFPLLSAVLVLLAASGALAVERPPAARTHAATTEVSWPPSLDLVIGEVVTGGASASDEYVEIYNRGSLTVDLGGLELVYATATGSTAYALSAGGPPIDPRVRAVVVVPLAPHAVISRAIVLPEMVTLRITVERGRVNAAADGISEIRLRDGAEMIIRPGPELAFVRFDNSPSFLRRLREKVRFGLPLKDLERPAVLRPSGGGDEGPPVIEARL
jgi:hypothetical protein